MKLNELMKDNAKGIKQYRTVAAAALTDAIAVLREIKEKVHNEPGLLTGMGDYFRTANASIREADEIISKCCIREIFKVALSQTARDENVTMC